MGLLAPKLGLVGVCCSLVGVGLGLGPHWCETLGLGKVRMWFLHARSWAQCIKGVLTSQVPLSHRSPTREVGKWVSSDLGVVTSRKLSLFKLSEARKHLGFLRERSWREVATSGLNTGLCRRTIDSELGVVVVM